MVAVADKWSNLDAIADMMTSDEFNDCSSCVYGEYDVEDEITKCKVNGLHYVKSHKSECEGYSEGRE